jgi:Carboxypeptidase regulatory-like domain/TonB dependent receptor
MGKSARLIWVPLLLGCAPLFAQKDAGSIVGTVLDATQASVPNAEVKAVNLDTNYTYRATTDTSGQYSMSPVRIGRYRVEATASGFKTAVSETINLDVQQRARVDLTLTPGAVQETIEVQAAAPLLDTDTTERGQVVNSRTMTFLPLNGRNAVQLAQLTPGVAFSEPGARDEAGYGFSANGARSLQNNFLLDGIDNNSNLPDLLNETNYVVMPSVDALNEFKVQTDSYGAEFGRANGAVVNATIKSGTNQFHGVGYEFLRNEKLDARNFFDVTKPPYRQNQFGFTFGGPIIKDHLFFFGDYEGLRIRQGQTNTALVPTAAQRAGDFSSQLDLTAPTGVTDCNGKPTYSGELFDTTLTQTSAASPTGFCGVPFGYNAAGNPSNIIPQSKMDPLGQKLAALYPSPNVNGNGFNYVANPLLNEDRNQGDVRVDQNFSEKDNAFYRFSTSRQPSTIPSTFPGLADGGGFFSGDEENTAYSAAVSETHVFSPTRVNELRLGYNRLHSRRFQFNSNVDVSAQVGFPGVPFSQGTNNGGLPQLTFNDMSTLGSPTYLPSNEIQNTYSVSDTFTLIKGAHTWKFGGEWRPEEFTIFQPADPRGQMSFGNQFTDNPAAPGTGGSGFSTLLTGQPDGGSINNLHNIDYKRQVYSGFVADDWRIGRKLTLNLGLRYEFFSTVKERFNSQANFNPITGELDIPTSSTLSLTPTFAALLKVNHNASNGLINPDLNNFAPRVGYAYQLTNRLVIRSAYGIFYNGDENGPYSNPSQGFNPPYFVSTAFNAPCGLPSYNAAAQDCSVPGIRSLQNGFPASALVDPNVPTLFSMDPNLRTPYVQQWHFTAQFEPTHDTVVEAAYVGSKGTKLFTFFNLNQAVPTADPSSPFAPRRAFPTIDAGISYFNSAGNSEYNALQTKFQRRFAKGLSVLAAYTWSHALGNASNANLGAQNNDSFRWIAHPEWEHANLDFDVRHRFVASYIWDVPFGKGHVLGGNASGVARQIVGNWQLSGITTISSGTWYTITDGNGNFANSDGQQRPDYVSGQPVNSHPCVAGTVFNTCAYADPPLGSFGNVGQNTVQGPGLQNWDMSLFKEFPFTESKHLQFRAEVFNLPNHTNFLFAKPGPQNSNNATVFGTPSFGYATAARAPRQIQFGLKFYF